MTNAFLSTDLRNASNSTELSSEISFCPETFRLHYASSASCANNWLSEVYSGILPHAPGVARKFAIRIKNVPNAHRLTRFGQQFTRSGSELMHISAVYHSIVLT
jgi:hypothetical protein